MALEYCLTRLYEIEGSSLEAYHAHLHAIECACDIHPDYLQLCVTRASLTVFNRGPFCWKHVEVAHGMLLETVPTNTLLMTHKPVLVVSTFTDRDPEICFFAQAFYMAFIYWTDDVVNELNALFSPSLLKHAESIDSFGMAASMAITWADWMPVQKRTNQDWERRFWAFGLLTTKCIPCPHSCGRVLIMGPDYFEQVDDAVTPNAALTPHTWSVPFGLIQNDMDTCTAHNSQQVTYSHATINAGEFIKVCMSNPLCISGHPMQFKEENGHDLARTLLSVVTPNMDPDEVVCKLKRITQVINEHGVIFEHQKGVDPAWPSKISSITMASVVSLVTLLQQADMQSEEAFQAVQAIAALILKFDFHHSSWYHNMLQDLRHPRYQAPIYDIWRENVKKKLVVDQLDFLN